MNLNYTKSKELLTSQSKFYINLGLDRIRTLLNLIGNPQDKIKVIHIAGTNGKGSVSAILAEILKSQGFKTGLYTSPHLIEYTERIKINNNDISQEDFALYTSEICTLAEKNNIDLTEFEILTAVCFKYFYDKKVDYAVMETGLGGRFDAVNVIKKSELSIITSISLDHTDRLGGTIEQIAFEKAGIIKDNSVVIINENNLGLEVIKKITDEKHSKLVIVKNIPIKYENGCNTALIDGKSYPFSLLGLYQQKNLPLAVKGAQLLNIPEDAIFHALKNVSWGARFEYIKEKNLIIDGAHNPDGALELKKNLDFYFKDKKKIFLYSSLNTKDYLTYAKNLFKEDDEIYFYEFHHKNALSYKEFILKNSWLKKVKVFDRNDLKAFLQKDCLKVVTGSLYMIGELYTDLKN